MSYPVLMMRALSEAVRARKLFPNPDHLLLAFTEEAGEVVKAALDFRNHLANARASGSPVNLTRAAALHEEVGKEIVQACAMLIRLWDEGDPTIDLDPQED